MIRFFCLSRKNHTFYESHEILSFFDNNVKTNSCYSNDLRRKDGKLFNYLDKRKSIKRACELAKWYRGYTRTSLNMSEQLTVLTKKFIKHNHASKSKRDII